ncbi:MAG TPA: dTMP kinase [Coriobacteriia bacterium]|jgi:dTMP kinase
MAGVFVTFEGGEGAGKSTQIALLAEKLRAKGLVVTTLREPGGTVVGDRVRDLLLDPAHTGLDPRAELLLYEASRAELVAEEIVPRVAAGDVVLCDRFTDSTLAYQGFGRGLDLDGVRALNDWATGAVVPDVTILLDVDPVLGLARATGTVEPDRLEAEDIAFHVRVRDGFLALADADKSDRFVVIGADASAEEVAAAVWETLRWHPAMHGVLH